MLRLGLGPQIGTNTPADSGGEQVIWKVAIFGAGTTTSNGEYIWDGTTLENGKPKYLASNNNYIYWASPYWWLFDYTEDRTTYASFESLTSWEIDDALEPAPSSTLSYAQDSEIQSVTLSDAGTASSNGEYVWNGSELQDGKPVYRNGSNTISFGDFGGESAEWGLYDDSAGDNTYLSLNLISWSINGGSSPAPSVLTLVYSA